MATPFIWGQGGQKLTPQQVERQRQVALSLLQGGSSFAPATGGFAEALGRGFQGWASGRLNRLAGEAEGAGMAQAAQRWQDLQPGMMGATAPAISPQGSGMAPSVGGSVAAALVPQGGGADMIRQGLLERGMPEHVADAFLLNFQDESGLNPGINEAAPIVPGSRGGFGLAQWTGPRRKQLEAFAAQRGADVADPNVQMDFLMAELSGPESKAAQAIFSAPDTGTAAAAIVNQFLRPAEEHRARREASYRGASGGTYMQPSVQNVSGIAEAMGDPWFAQQYGPVAEALMGQQMQMQTAAYQQQLAQQDPAYQMGLEKAQLELDAMRNPAPPKPVFEGGQWWDTSSGAPQPITERAQDPTSLIQNLQAAGLQPGTPEFAQAVMDATLKPGVSVTVGGEGGRNAKFDERLGTARADRYIGIQTAGTDAQRRGVQIGQLSSALEGAPEGLEAVAKSWLGKQGLKTEGLDKLQLAEALISQLVPAQRPPGSGTISDADLALYKASLPRLINTREGNRLIIDTMNGIMRHDLMAGEIADKVIAGQISPDEGDAMLRALPNPFEGFQDVAAQVGDDPAAASGDAGKPPAGIDPADWEYMTPEERALFQ